jgi:hypothetical protein
MSFGRAVVKTASTRKSNQFIKIMCTNPNSIKLRLKKSTYSFRRSCCETPGLYKMASRPSNLIKKIVYTDDSARLQ